jgi:hypothetical protein
VDIRTRLAKTGDSPTVADAIDALLERPDAIDLRINLVGEAHLSGWTGNRCSQIRACVDNSGAQWAARCVERVSTDPHDLRAMCAMLSTDARVLLRQAARYASSVPVLRWDHAGPQSEQTAGLGLARRESTSALIDYLYVGWMAYGGSYEAVRVDHVRRIEVDGVLPAGAMPLNGYEGTARYFDWGWCETPRRHGWNDACERDASADPESRGFTTALVDELAVAGHG